MQCSVRGLQACRPPPWSAPVTRRHRWLVSRRKTTVPAWDDEQRRSQAGGARSIDGTSIIEGEKTRVEGDAGSGGGDWLADVQVPANGTRWHPSTTATGRADPGSPLPGQRRYAQKRSFHPAPPAPRLLHISTPREPLPAGQRRACLSAVAVAAAALSVHHDAARHCLTRAALGGQRQVRRWGQCWWRLVCALHSAAAAVPWRCCCCHSLRGVPSFPLRWRCCAREEGCTYSGNTGNTARMYVAGPAVAQRHRGRPRQRFAAPLAAGRTEHTSHNTQPEGLVGRPSRQVNTGTASIA
ncbi:hypothetical protein BDV95DRAFT_596179 [Massariosphaeria phaeospora]|uniref:Uncharacterized protein n=1 Tax=Massariosphaeria phaeospora TaxID=100035 RepID=A0A7C8I776_9PLEO|nr:hypothetical protein BDV95DRAFT_596179 [Massariosphaeria phaeospora]